jgi:hypothetical protein
MTAVVVLGSATVRAETRQRNATGALVGSVGGARVGDAGIGVGHRARRAVRIPLSVGVARIDAWMRPVRRGIGTAVGERAVELLVVLRES